VLPALVTSSEEKAARALDQLMSPRRFAAPYGPTFVARSHRAYSPNGYWRGTAWMQMSYLARLAALRWERGEVAEQIAQWSRRGAMRSGFAEHWNPETGKGRGAVPLTWAALVAAM
jgi:glycogen debranching enzyme